jgi:hypothetical protein
MRNRNRITLMLSASVLAAGLSVAATATAASAAVTPNALPHGCGYTQPNDWSATTKCDYGPGQQRANITCRDGLTGNMMHEYGPWVQWYQNSTASCGNGVRYVVVFVTSDVRS